MKMLTLRTGRRLARLALVAGLTLLIAPAAQAARPAAADTAAVRAANWIAGQQLPNGSFPGFGVGSTADAIVGLAAAGAPANPRTASGPSALDYLATQAASYAKSPGAAAKLLLAIGASGEARDAHAFGGADLLKEIADSYDAGSGHYGKDVTGQALVILALAGRGEAVPAAAVHWLEAAQGSEGGWAFDGTTGPGSADTNTTGLALQALAAAHSSNAGVVQRALGYLRRQQNADGGFAYQQGPGNASDANSTALVVLGLQAAGQDPASAGWARGGASPVAFLRGLQNASGALRYQAGQPDDNAGATYQAVPALAGRVLPIQAGAPSAQPGMPTTGAGDPPGWPGAAVLAALALLVAGVRLTRAAPGRGR